MGRYGEKYTAVQHRLKRSVKKCMADCLFGKLGVPLKLNLNGKVHILRMTMASLPCDMRIVVLTCVSPIRFLPRK